MSRQTICDGCRRIIGSEELHIDISASLHGLTAKEDELLSWEDQSKSADFCVGCWSYVVGSLPVEIRGVPTARPTVKPE